MAINDLLLPLVKGVGSERSYEQLAQALQTFGGSGYLQDYPLEQYIRDAKIDTLYEGTTAIQGLDFFFRKIVRNQGAALNAVAGEISAFLDSIGDESAGGRLKVEREAVRTALADVRGIVVAMTSGSGRRDRRSAQRLPGRAEHHPAAARRRRPHGRLPACCARPWSRRAGWTTGGLNDADRAFYEGKVGGGAFLRRVRPAGIDRPATRGRGHRQHPDGRARVGLLRRG